MSTDPGALAPGYLLPLCFGVTVVMQCSFFAVAFLCQFDKVTDLAGTLNFLVLALLSLVVQGIYSTRTIVVTAFVVVWALRLGSYLLIRVLNRGKDERFDQMRGNCLNFFGFWVFQIFWVFVVSTPVMLVNSGDDAVDVAAFGTASDVLGTVLWVIGFVIEAVADSSKDAFYRNKENRGKLLCSGVWKYSRHPNYFGEIVCWTGVFLLSAATFVGDQKWFAVGVVSPLMTFILLMFLSGIPLAEERYDTRFGAQPFYLEYKKSTSPVIPFPPSIYRELPMVIKQWLFFELPMYSVRLRSIQAEQSEHPYYQSTS
ncbi:TPA: hypothetical protein N0F65_002993 [Lagenidium giganteum]|uniref:Steroid 5-alpha reductase C-terminal domain-containing protein n=1 Tax=Lagenidium giganteum TaxID=4803 RepID=A0AAV2YQS4_9STRA|nr:TPA: hypothetical protein N0F65_002993 [Lagenidium giganteum]